MADADHLAGEALREETTCTCGAGHGSGEPHMEWCAYRPRSPRLAAFNELVSQEKETNA